MPQASLTTVVNIVSNIIGLYKGWGATPENAQRWDSTTISNVAKITDAETAATIAKTPGHPAGNTLFTDSTEIAHKGVLPDSLAGYANIRVDGEHAEEAASTVEISRLRSHEVIATDEQYNPYYKIWGKSIYHTGTSAIVGYFPAQTASGDVLLSPIEYTYTVVIGTLRIMALKDFGEGGIASDLAQEYRSRQAMIKEDANLGIIRETPALVMKGQQ